jgi:hypothetical protein
MLPERVTQCRPVPGELGPSVDKVSGSSEIEWAKIGDLISSVIGPDDPERIKYCRNFLHMVV